MSVYQEHILLRNKDVEMHRRLRTSSLFQMLQEASIRHTEELGMGRKMTLDRGLLWMIGMQRAEIARMPVYDEQIVLKTWPGETMHVFFPRYYRVETPDGEPLIQASALWTLVDAQSRRMVFPDRYGVRIDGVKTGKEIALPSSPARLPCTEETIFRVPYSYVDLNGHMNNTRYFDLAEDCIPAAAEGAPLRLIQTEYVSEARFGAELHVKWGRAEGGYFLLGEAEKPIFRMRFEYGAET